MKVALVYDWVHTFGGAERVLLSLKKIFPRAPLFTSIYDKENAVWAKEFKITPSFLNNFPLAKSHHQLYPLLTPLAFEQFDFSSFDVVISITSSDAKGIITKPNTLHICYMLTPTRYIWSHKDKYIQNPFARLVSKPFIKYLRIWDKVAVSRPDIIVAISNTVRGRIKKYYNKDVSVIYPPVVKQKDEHQNNRYESSYYLVVSRLVPYKRIDLVIKACNRLNRKLIIVGKGRSYNYLKSIASGNIIFKHSVSEKELIKLYTNCKALIIACEEDFGLSAIEVQMYGKPVIALKKGGVLETVISRKTGIFFENQTEEDIRDTILSFEKLKFSEKDCTNNASRFSESKFNKEFIKFVNFHYKRFFRII